MVCTRLAQWNLTPLDERWEAIEAAEELFRGAKLRHSTDNIGLAKLPDGTELVRIRALRPEMAAWRYGQNFVRRRKAMAVGIGLSAAVLGGSALLLPAGLVAGLAGGALSVAAVSMQTIRLGGKVAFVGSFIRDNEQQYVRVSPKELGNVRLIPHASGWALRVPYQTRRPRLNATGRT